MYKPNSEHCTSISAHSPGRSVCGTALVLALLCLGLSALAAPQSKAPAPQSPSTGPTPQSSYHEHAKTKPAVKPHPTIQISSEDAADAILADSLNRITDLADEHFHVGEWNHCINLLYVDVQGDPHNVDSFSNAAYLLWSTDRDPQGIAFLKKGIEANPDNFYMYDELGTHYWIHLHDASNAIPYLEKAIQFKCPFTTYHNLAFCYQKLGQWDKAVKTWETATRFTNDTQAQRHLKQAQEQLAKMQGGGK